jgi:uncharacterized membrane protein YqiK
MPELHTGNLLAIGIPIVALFLILICYRLILRVFGVIIIPKNTIGIVYKKFVLVGSNKTLPDGEIIALKGEAGIQADTLPPGIHFWRWPWQYGIQIQEFVTIEQGKIGVVEARGGKPLANGRVLAKKVESDCFQSVRVFLQNGGERGPQIAIIPPGTYRINTGFFGVTLAPVVQLEDNTIGVVTTQDGKPLPTGEIAGKEIPAHNMFQDGEAFIQNGGHKGLQEQVLLAGQYFINPRFATIEIKPMIDVPIAHVGVVISYVGEAGADVTGVEFKHGNMVKKGEKGVWVEPLDPGKYPINPYTNKVECVPTANVVLNWATGKTEAHKLDENLCTIKVRSSDGFTFNLDVSQIIHKQETVTYETQRQAQEIRQKLQQATAMADTQAKVVDSERSVTIADFQAKAAVKQAEGLAQAKKVQAEADAMVVTTVGNAEATKVKAVGTAEADVIKMKISSMEAGNYASVQVAQALAGSRIPIVPNIMVSGSGGNGSGGTLVDVLLANMLTGQLKEKTAGTPAASESITPTLS